MLAHGVVIYSAGRAIRGPGLKRGQAKVWYNCPRAILHKILPGRVQTPISRWQCTFSLCRYLSMSYECQHATDLQRTRILIAVSPALRAVSSFWGLEGGEEVASICLAHIHSILLARPRLAPQASAAPARPELEGHPTGSVLSPPPTGTACHWTGTKTKNGRAGRGTSTRLVRLGEGVLPAGQTTINL